MRKSGLCAFVMAAALVWGCGDAGNGRDDPPPAAATPEPPARTTDSVRLGLPAPTDPSRPPGSIGATAAEGEIVSATIENGRIVLSRDTIPAGEVTVVVQNKGGAPCAFELASQFAGRWALGRVAPGGNAQMSMVLATAPYNVYCVADAAVGARATADTVRLIVR